MKITKLCFIVFCFCAVNLTAQKFTVSGIVLDSISKEPLIGASIYDEVKSNWTISNSMGFFSFESDSSKSKVYISFIGYETQEITINKDNIESITILMSAKEIVLSTVNITKKKKESENVQLSKIEIPIQQLQAVPSILGESDPLKIAQTLPGVQSGGEATPGLFVRGSASDQNLVMIDDAPIYNPFHLFGIFSVINSDALKTFEITKGGYSSEYGGRLASVVNMNLKEGNKNKFSGDISLGLATSKILLETPLVKDKVSLMFSGRASYAHLLVQPFLPKDQFGSYNFFDFSTKISAELSSRTKLYCSAMYSGDNFSLTDETTYYSKYYDKVSWSNIASSLRLNHIINQKFFWNASLLYSKYDLSSSVTQKEMADTYRLQYKTNIQDIGLKNDFTYYLNNKNTLKFGVISTQKTFAPDAVTTKNKELSEFSRAIKKYQTWESAVYLEDEFKIGKKIMGRVGGRINMYQYNNTIINPEPRISLAYNFVENWSIKTSYTQMHQYMHLLTSKGIGLPTDLWIPATNKVPYKKADQYTLSLTRDIPKQDIGITIEGYYKQTNNDISFKEGTSFMQSKNLEIIDQSDLSWENNITTGTSWNYGSELFIHKKSGRLQGWIGYTLSWSLSQFKELNFGKTFYSRQDRRHNLSIMLIYQLTKKISLTANWVYMTGNPITVANSVYNYGELTPNNVNIPLSYPWVAYDYSGINNYRMPAYHRLDIGINYKMVGKHTIREFEFSVYNVYNRQNPYFYYVLSNVTPTNGTQNSVKQVSVIPILPSINYKIKF